MKNESKNMPKISKDFGRKALSLLMAATLVISEIPTQAIGNGVEAGQEPAIEEVQQAEPEASVEEAPVQQEEAPAAPAETAAPAAASVEEVAPAAAPAEESAAENVAKVTIDFDEYTFIKYADAAGNEQAVDFHMTEPLNLPANKEFKFTVETVDGYVDPKVEFELNGNKDEVKPDEKGEYTLSAADVATGLVLKATSTKEEAAQDADAAEVVGEAGFTTLDLSDFGDGTVSPEMLAESKEADQNEKTLSISINFVGADGNSTDATLDKTVYAYIKGNNNQKITLPLQKEGSTLSVSVKGLLDQNGNKKNDGSYYDLTDGTYEVTLFTTNDGGSRNEGWNFDGNNITILADGAMMGSSAVLHLPDAKTVSQSAPFVATAEALAGGYAEISYAGILDDAINFGVVANVFSQNSGDAETNVAAKVATCTTQTGNDLTNAVEQTFMFGEVENEFKIKGKNAFVIVPASDAEKVKATGDVRLQYDTTQTADQINAVIDGMIRHASAQSDVLAGMIPNAFLEKEDGSHYKVDVRGRGEGAYVLSLSADEYQKISGQADALHIYKDDGQTIMFNVLAGGSINIAKYSVNGSGADSFINENPGNNPRTIVFNFPYAESITTTGSVSGIFLAPKATWHNQNTSAGWIICDKFMVGAGEWHNNYDNVVKLSTSVSFKAKKNIDGAAAPVSASGFEFKLERVDGYSLSTTNKDTVRTVKNFGQNVNLGLVTYTVDDLRADGTATYVYKVTEVGSKTDLNGFTYENDTRVVYAKIDLKEKDILGDGKIEKDVAVSGPVYYSDEACTQPITDEAGLPIFNNKSQGEERYEATGFATIKVSKTVKGTAAGKAGFEFTLTQVANEQGGELSGAWSETKTTDENGALTFSALNYTEADADKTYYYKLTETKKSGYTSSLGDEGQIITVAVSDNGDGTLDVKVDGEDSSHTVEVTNTYAAEGGMQLKGTKSVKYADGSVVKDAKLDGFVFTLSGEDDAPMPRSGQTTVTTNDKGEFSFNTIDFTAAGIYKYELTETAAPSDYANGTFEHMVKKAVVATVTDGGNGKLNVSVSVDGTKVAEGQSPDVVLGELVNTYTAKSTSATISGTKTLTGRKLEAGEFQFGLYERNEQGTLVAVLDDQGSPIVSANRDDGTFELKTPTYTTTGEHQYVVKEIKGNLPGVTYSDLEYNVTVKVTDNGKGQLVAVVNPAEKSAITFTNAYVYSADGSLVIQGQKVLQGRTATKGDTFEFELVGSDGAPMPKSKAATVDLSKDPFGSFAFDKIEFGIEDAGKTYTYEVREVLPEGVTAENPTKDGVTYDTSAQTVTVKVSDNGDGTLKVEPTYPRGNGVVFTNTYNASTSVALMTKKKFESNSESVSMKAGDFTFGLFEEDGVTPVNGADGKQLTATNDANGSVVFPAISYGLEDRGITYIYVMKELVPEDANPGIAYDTHAIKASVVVTDANNGKLNVVATYSAESGQSAEGFTNTYMAKSTQVQLTAKKELTVVEGSNRKLGAGEFSFTLSENDKELQTKENDANGKVAFDAIEYTEAGEHTYTIAEVKGDLGGVTYSTETKTVKVVVTDDGKGQLVAKVTEPEDGVIFTNTYGAEKTTDVKIEGTKDLTGRAINNGEFSFALYKKGESEPLKTVTNNGKSFSFDLGSFEAAGTYEYVVKEVKGNLGGVTYDESAKDVTVKVTDNGKGQLEASVSYPEGGLVFSNAYTAKSTTAKISGTKSLEGRALKDGEFTFELVDAKGDVVNTATNKDGEFTLSTGELKAAGTYEYTVREAKGNAKGVTYDSSDKKVTVTVTDDLKGELHASVAYPKDGLSFSNKFEAQGSITLEGTKVVENTNGTAQTPEGFTFTLTPNVEGGQPLTATTDKNGKFSFSITGFDQDDAGKTFTYALDEQAREGFAKQFSAKTVTVEVSLADDGTLVVAAQGLDSKDGAYQLGNFINKYSAEKASTTISGGKSLTGRSMVAGEFSFELVDGDKVVASATNAADGSFAFSTPEYTEPGTHKYVVREANTGKGGVAYDTTTFDVTVMVTDNGKGGLVATATLPEGGIKFTNSYAAAASTAEQVIGTKSLEGRGLRDGEFEFGLYEGETLIASARNVGNGFTIKTPSYSEVGTHNYMVREVNTGVAGVTYSGAQFPVTVEVSDNGVGKLVANVSYPSGTPAFTNKYQGAAVSAEVKGTKYLEGRTMVDDEFTFELVDAKGDVVNTATNKDGEFTLSTGELKVAGTYEYTVREAKGTNKGVTYDDHIFRVKVKVTDPGDGKMVASVSYLDGTPEFRNSYEAKGSVALKATKVLTGREKKDSEFQFKVVEDDEVVSTGTNGTDDKVNFSAINYTLSDLGEHTYTVSEVNAQDPSITYDNTSFTVRVNVTDNYDGTLKAEATYPKGGVTFTNTYFKADAQVTATKHYYGSDSNAKFSFELKAADDQFNVRGKGATTVSDDAAVDDGKRALTLSAINDAFEGDAANVKFPQITYYKPGTYYYVMSEAAGNGATDAAVYHVTVTVSEDMSTSVTYQLVGEDAASDPVFYNNANVQLAGRIMTLGAKADQIELTGFEPEVKKELVGATLSAGEFAFDLVQVGEKGQALEGGVSQTQTVNADGEVAFDYIGFNTEGTYHFAITEKPTSFKVVDGQTVAFVDAGIVYDSEPIYLDVVVAKNDDGTFKAEATYTKDGVATDAPVFTNTRRTVVVRTQKCSKEAPYEPLQGAVYGLWMLNPDGNDVYLGNQTSDADGWITFDVPLQQGVAYYFKEEKAPAKHLVDPVRSEYFTLVDNNGAFALAYEGSSEFAAAMPGVATR